MKKHIAALVVLLLVGASFLGLHRLEERPKTRNATELNESALRSFLESQYVPEAGLLRAAVTAYPDNETIYVANDNLLAARALILLGSPLGERIQKNLNENYSSGRSGKVDVLLGRPIEGFFCSETDIMGKVYSRKFQAEFTVKRERANPSCQMSDWDDYADLLAYAAINETLSGNRTGAMRFYRSLLAMWDGNGFRDKAFGGVYQTYKCALFVYLYRMLGKPSSGQKVYERCIGAISNLQARNGGIITGYQLENGKITPVGDTNTETTSMVVLALYSDYSEKIYGKVQT
ncbi:hypothetical protein A3L09_03890 [Thermococcus profundus]|uniref:Uncharacterized protein n=1 Tax=Thermococcus profundus TaxID=49899 RepID=A0A2Z2MEV6_THEPR|nr:hypothetical protein [Thermococcus profundus]ASJ02454.1 hypothetical protein A3L09_03890 [Thermococcus profundus]